VKNLTKEQVVKALENAVKNSIKQNPAIANVTGANYQARSNLFKKANFLFNPETMTASSYLWWSLLQTVNGKLVFNSYSYSSQTAKHQSVLRTILRTLAVKIDIEIEAPHGLQDLTRAMAHMVSLYAELRVKEKYARDEGVYKAQIKETVKKIDFLRSAGCKVSDQQLSDAVVNAEENRQDKLIRGKAMKERRAKFSGQMLEKMVVNGGGLSSRPAAAVRNLSLVK